MKQLTFRARYVPLILDGSKTTTIRRPRPGLPVAGERVRLICRYDQPPFALATVAEAVDIYADQLTEADARADGFASLADLLDALEEHAADRSDGPDALPLGLSLCWRMIRFTLDS